MRESKKHKNKCMVLGHESSNNTKARIDFQGVKFSAGGFQLCNTQDDNK